MKSTNSCTSCLHRRETKHLQMSNTANPRRADGASGRDTMRLLLCGNDVNAFTLKSNDVS